MTVQNDWKLLQNYLKKINLATFEVENKENDLENEFNSNVDLYYKYKRKIRLLNDNNLELLGLIPKLNNYKIIYKYFYFCILIKYYIIIKIIKIIFVKT